MASAAYTFTQKCHTLIPFYYSKGKMQFFHGNKYTSPALSTFFMEIWMHPSAGRY